MNNKVEFVVLMKHFLFAETFEGFDTKVLEVSNVTLLYGWGTTCTFFEDENMYIPLDNEMWDL